LIAGWSSLVARQAHNLKVVGSNPAPATNLKGQKRKFLAILFLYKFDCGMEQSGSSSGS
jgi:hypothetical protein